MRNILRQHKTFSESILFCLNIQSNFITEGNIKEIKNAGKFQAVGANRQGTRQRNMDLETELHVSVVGVVGSRK